jgi:recombinational DNA repair ATPase RecF
MRIHKLHLQDFRGFASFNLELHPDMTLLVGRNGSGKTGILEGLAVALGAWFSGMSTGELRRYD